MQAMRSDIYETQGGTTQEGIHCGVMGGTIDLFLRWFAGLSIQDDRISLDPKLPEKWQRIKFRVRYRDVWFIIEIDKNQVTVKANLLKRLTLQQSSEILIDIRGKTQKLTPGQAVTVIL